MPIVIYTQIENLKHLTKIYFKGEYKLIEYLYNAIRATAGEDITLTARLTDENGENLGEGVPNHISLYNDIERLGSYNGRYIVDGLWEYTIPAEATAELKGRYWYCLCTDDKHTKLNFKQPLYLV